jgi:ubiquinone biosynthesis protein
LDGRQLQAVRGPHGRPGLAECPGSAIVRRWTHLVNWNATIDVQSVRSLLSAEYAGLARPIREALIVFLSGLPADAQEAILAAQASLPPDAGPARRLGRLAQECPVLHKLGQTLARDRRIEPALRRELCRLEMLPCSIPADTLRDLIVDELGSLSGLGIQLASTPIAEASVAIVTAYRDQQRDGVFKVLKPGIEERLALELVLLARVGAYLDERCVELGIPRLDYESSFRQVQDKLTDEVRLGVEQRHLALAADQYAGVESVQIPALREYCTPRITAMERVIGPKVSEHGRRTTAGKRRIAFTLASALLAQPLLSTRQSVLFHGDPHAGNLLLTRQGRIAILDWSLAGTLTQGEREAILQILIGAMMRDEGRIAGTLDGFAGGGVPDRGLLESVIRRRLHELRRGRRPDFAWVIGLMDDAVQQAGLKVSERMLVFRKSLHTLLGLVADISTDDRPIDEALFLGFLRHLAAEWPLRWLAEPDSRAFATRLSNRDLAELMLRSPLALMRSWL